MGMILGPGTSPGSPSSRRMVNWTPTKPSKANQTWKVHLDVLGPGSDRIHGVISPTVLKNGIKLDPNFLGHPSMGISFKAKASLIKASTKKTPHPIMEFCSPFFGRSS